MNLNTGQNQTTCFVWRHNTFLQEAKIFKDGIFQEKTTVKTNNYPGCKGT